jgi:hypothetical protein
MADHFHNFHTKIQILANLNENMVNSHFPEEHGHAAHCRRRRRQNGPTATSEIDTTTPEAGPSSKEGEERGPPTIRPRLPLELLELILRHLSKAELFHVLQANKALHSVAVRLLYRDLAIASSDSEESTPAQAILSFLKGLLANNSVHKHVRKLDINLATIQCPTANFYRLLHRLLRGTTGLVVLGLDLPKSQSPVWILEGCAFKLRQFSTSMHCTPELARFLDSQDNIGHLTLRGFQHDALRSLPFIYSGVPSPHSEDASPSDQFTLKETSLPRLTCFNAIHAGPGVVKEVVRGRPVATASIPLFSLNSLNALDALETSATPLRRLSVISFDPDAPTFIFEQVAKRFPELEALHIVVLLAEFTNVGFGKLSMCEVPC